MNQSSETRTFAYDSLKRLIASTNPEKYSVASPPALGCANGVYANCYTYDSNGNLLTKTDNHGLGIQYQYDPLNRVLNETYFNTLGTINYPSVAYTYDEPKVPYSKGRRTAVTTLPPPGSTSFQPSTSNITAFDGLGRVYQSSQTTAGNTYSFTYQHNDADALTGETYPSGDFIYTCYDTRNRATQVGPFAACGSATGANAYNVLYAAHGAPTQFTLGNQITRTITYNPRLQLSSFADAPTSNPNNPLLSATLTWNPSGTSNNNGNLWTATYSHGGPGYPTPLTFTDTFTYDPVNRLQTANDSGGWSRTFAYDAYGNMTPTGNPAPPTVSFNANNQINGLPYDQTGNQLKVNGNATAYDFESRVITEADGVTGAVENYVYDGDGHRVEQYGATPTTVFVYDAMGQLAAEYSTAAASSPCGAFCYLTTDHLGSTRLVTDANGNVVARHDYLPFGEEVAASTFGRDTSWNPGTDFVNQKFTGKERDSAGLDYFGARYYGSAQGRWTSPDWSDKPEPVPYADLENPQTLNLYTYGRNDPLSVTDQDGHCTKDGQQRGYWWCLFHDSDQDAENARKALSQMNGFTINGKTPADFAKNASNEEAINALRSADNFLAGQVLAPCTADISCGVIIPPIGPVGEIAAAAKEGAAAESEGIVAQNGTKVTGFTTHGINRVVGDNAGRAGTRPEAILDALRNPKKITSGVDSKDGLSKSLLARMLAL